MERLRALQELAIENESKILFWIFDGIGGLPHAETGKTELETAHIPKMDAFAQRASCGGLVPHGAGVTPGSGPGHLSLFGYPLDEFDLPRGVLEVLGAEGAYHQGEWVGPVQPQAGDLAMRGNFASLEWKGEEAVVSDRRAGRPPTEDSRRLCERLSATLQLDGVEIYVFPGKEHRCALLLRGQGLKGPLRDSDPQKEGLSPLDVATGEEGTEKAARVVTELVEQIYEELADDEVAQGLLVRGIGNPPELPTLEDLYGIKAAAIATYPMYKGIARLVGMDVLEVDGMEHADEVATLKKHFEEYDFFYLHIKETDSVAHNGDFDAKVKIFEACDELFGEAAQMGFDVVALSGDHCTPCVLGDHSWHPIPTALWSKTVLAGGAEAFDELEIRKGSLGQIASRDLMPLALAEAGRFNKFGA